MMKILIAVILVWVQVALPGVGWGATYTVCPSGCTGTTPLSVINAIDLAPDDILEIQADVPGGTKTFTAKINPEADDVGAAGHPIRVIGRSGDLIILDGTGNDRAWQFDASDVYITLENVSLYGGTTANVQQIGTGVGNQLLNCKFLGGSAYGFFGGLLTAGYTLHNLDFTGAYTTVAMSAGAAGEVVVDISDITVSGGSDRGINFGAGSFTGSNVNRLNVSEMISHGITTNSSTNLTINSANLHHNGGDGLTQTIGSVTVNDSIADSNGGDGWHAGGAGTLNLHRVVGSNNGSALTTTGDGATAHENCTLNIDYSMFVGNWNTGVGVTGAGCSGSVYNCTLINNGHLSSDERRSNIWIDASTGTWVLRNNITDLADFSFTVTNPATVTIDTDYNLYGEGVFKSGVVAQDFATWKANAGIDDSHSVVAAPLLDAQYHPLSNSPAINAGAIIAGIHDQATPATDINGTQVLGTPDIGAVEYYRRRGMGSSGQYQRMQ